PRNPLGITRGCRNREIREYRAARGLRARGHCRENQEDRLRRVIPLHGFIPGLTDTVPSSETVASSPHIKPFPPVFVTRIWPLSSSPTPSFARTSMRKSVPPVGTSNAAEEPNRSPAGEYASTRMDTACPVTQLNSERIK